MAKIWTRKSIAALEAEAAEPEVQALTTHDGVPLKRTLSAINLVSLGIGAIIGAGIFVLTGHAAAANAGPAITLSFVLGAIACAFAGLCYAEMASTVPIAGSAYTYAYATLGEFIAWIIGWDLILEYALGATTVAIGWSGYVVSFLKGFGIVMPPAFAIAPFAYDAGDRVWHATGAIINLPAMVVVVGISALLVVGVRESARVNNFIVAIKLVIVVLFIAVVASHVSTENWVTAGNPAGSFIPPNIGPGQFGMGGVVRGAAVVFFAYIGFDAVSTAAQEAKNPQRDMPIGILGSLVICTVLYVAVGFVLTGIVAYDKLNVLGSDRGGHRCGRAQLSVADHQTRHCSRPDLGHPGHAARAVARLLFDGARRPAAAGRRPGASAIPHAVRDHDRHRHRGDDPRRLSCRSASSASWSASARCSPSPSSALGVLVLRIREPGLPRAFRTPAVYVVAPLGAASSLFLMFGLPLDTWLRFGIWLVIGLVIYAVYGVRHALAAHQPSASRA